MAAAFAGQMIFQPLYGYIAEYLGKEFIPYLALSGVLIGFIFITIISRKIKKEQSKNM